MSLTVTGGTANTYLASASGDGNIFSFGANTLTAGNGNRDTQIGNIGSKDANGKLTNGLSLTVNGGASTGGDTHAEINNNNFAFGSASLLSLLVNQSMNYTVYNTNGGAPVPVIIAGVLSISGAGLSGPVATGAVSNFYQDLSTLYYGPNHTNFAELFTGQIYISQAGTYTFQTTSDDGSTLSIDNTFVVSNYNYQGATQRTGSILLSTGYHTIGVAYFQGGGANYLNFGETIMSPNAQGNTLVAGNGNHDILIGSTVSLGLSVTGNTANPGYAPAFENNNTFTYGANNLTAGNGNNDILIGNIGNGDPQTSPFSLVLSATGGTATATAAFSSANAFVQVDHNIISMNANQLTVGNGSNSR